MSNTAHPLASLIEHEERIRNTYRDLLGDTVQSNIRYFIKPFLDSHNDLLCKLKSYGKMEVESGIDDEDAPLDLAATDHLESEKEVDVSSLQSVLLYLAKTESDSMAEFVNISQEFTDPGIKEFIRGISEEKNAIYNKADTLYHDMIESKIS